MKLSDLLDIKVITTNLKATDKSRALREMVDILHKAGRVKDPDTVFETLLEHELIGTTGIGNGVAFPHASIDGLKEPIALLAISQQGVDFNAKDDHPCYLFFFFLTPRKETTLHLQILSKAATLFTDKHSYHSLRKAKTPQIALSLLLHYEKGGKEVFFPHSIHEIYQELETSPSGLSENEAKKRLEGYGKRTQGTKGKTALPEIYRKLVQSACHPPVGRRRPLFVADMPQLGYAIFAVILINAVFSFWQEYKAEKALDALKRLMPRKTKVLRDDKQREISVDELVPGDIVFLEEGDSISADARLIEAYNVRVDNSALTGESQPIYKTSVAISDGKEFLWTELPNLVFAGATVTSGTGKAAVIATGMQTEIGRIASITQELKGEKSPLQREIEKVTKIVTLLSVAMGVIFFFLGTSIGKLSIPVAFVFAIGIIVANVPEGLLPTVSLSLAMAVQRMAGRNALIKAFLC